MTTNLTRSYNCKDEELPEICSKVAFSVKRDLDEFAAYSPMFTNEYIVGYDAQIATVSELLEPQSETLAKKVITDRLYTTMDGLLVACNHIEGYILLAKKDLKLTPTDFGVPRLRMKIKSRDAEGVLGCLATISTHIATYKPILASKGLSDAFIDQLKSAAVAIKADKQAQYEILSNRKNIVQANLGVMNSLAEQMNEILSVGRRLYKGKDAVKVQEYTFDALKRSVRVVSSKKNNSDNKNENNSDAGKATT